MKNPDPNAADQQERFPLVDLPRLGMVVGTAVLAMAGLYWGADFASRNGYGSSLFGYGFLILAPFVVTLVFGVLFRVYWKKGIDSKNLLATIISIALVVALMLALLASPVLVCLTIVAPLWLVGAIAGGIASRWLVKYPARTQAVVIACLLASMAAALALEPRLGHPTDHYVVARSVEISAAPDQVWPHLLKLSGLRADEGRRNFSQDFLGIPRPVEAIVRGAGAGAVRQALWQRGIWFEEHITTWKPGELLEWKFVFPEGSTFTAMDQHIDPRGPNLVIATGGYRLTPLPTGSSRLELFTTYTASTAVNAYSSLWGELILGDVQNNILSIVKNRAEASSKANPPVSSSSLIAAN